MPKGCPPCGAENADDARFCRLCGVAFAADPAAVPVDEAAARSPSTPRASRSPWIAVGGLALTLTVAVGIAGWLQFVRSKEAPTFDSAPPPSVLDAARVSAAPAASAATVVATPPPAPVPSPPTSDAKPVDMAKATAAAASPERLEGRPAGSQARALPNPRPVARAVADEAGASRRQTVQEQCAGRNPLLTGICEARQCMRAEHAAEAVCRRIKAADDRRREQ